MCVCARAGERCITVVIQAVKEAHGRHDRGAYACSAFRRHSSMARRCGDAARLTLWTPVIPRSTLRHSCAAGGRAPRGAEAAAASRTPVTVLALCIRRRGLEQLARQ